MHVMLPNGTVEVNQRSPATYLNEDRFGTTPVPASANAEAQPVWKVQDKTDRLRWHDHRMHFMSRACRTRSRTNTRGPRSSTTDPILVGEQAVVLTGTLFWRGTPKGSGRGARLAGGGRGAGARRHRACAKAAARTATRRRGAEQVGRQTKEAW